MILVLAMNVHIIAIIIAVLNVVMLALVHAEELVKVIVGMLVVGTALAAQAVVQKVALEAVQVAVELVQVDVQVVLVAVQAHAQAVPHAEIAGGRAQILARDHVFLVARGA
jgi:hypothetical protein